MTISDLTHISKRLKGLKLVKLCAEFVDVHGTLWVVTSPKLIFKGPTEDSCYAIQMHPDFANEANDDSSCVISISLNTEDSPDQAANCVVTFDYELEGDTRVADLKWFTDRRLLFAATGEAQFATPSALRIEFVRSKALYLWHEQDVGEERVAAWQEDADMAEKWKALSEILL